MANKRCPDLAVDAREKSASVYESDSVPFSDLFCREDGKYRDCDDLHIDSFEVEFNGFPNLDDSGFYTNELKLDAG